MTKGMKKASPLSSLTSEYARESCILYTTQNSMSDGVSGSVSGKNELRGRRTRVPKASRNEIYELDNMKMYSAPNVCQFII